MEALRTHHIGEGGDMHMESALTDIDGKIGRDVKEVYVGPSALWIAKLIPRRGQLQPGLVPDDDGDLPRRSLGWVGVQAEARRQRHRRALSHPGLLSRRGDGRAGDGDGAVHPERIRANRQTG